MELKVEETYPSWIIWLTRIKSVQPKHDIEFEGLFHFKNIIFQDSLYHLDISYLARNCSLFPCKLINFKNSTIHPTPTAP